MQESLKLFSSVINSPWFAKSSVMLFLNKRDLFEEKLKTYPLSDVFEDYKGEPFVAVFLSDSCSFAVAGGPNYEAASKFVQIMYEGQRMDLEKYIYTHKTCATDTKNVEFVLRACFDIILKVGLSKSGLL